MHAHDELQIASNALAYANILQIGLMLIWQ